MTIDAWFRNRLHPLQNRWPCLTVLVVALLVAMGSMCAPRGLQADENDPAATAADEPPSDKAKEGGVEDKQPSPPAKTEDPLDAELLKSLGGAGESEDEAGIDQLERAINAMREIQQRMEAEDTGKETVELQRGVLRDLTRLIEEAQKQLQNPQDSQSEQQKDKDKEKNKKSAGKRKLKSWTKVQQGSQAPKNAGKSPQELEQAEEQARQNAQAQDSSEKVDPKKAAEVEAARQRQLVKDVWGHLPPALREELLNVYSEKYLPRYEDLVRRYYEALAEKNKPRGR